MESKIKTVDSLLWGQHNNGMDSFFDEKRQRIFFIVDSMVTGQDD